MIVSSRVRTNIVYKISMPFITLQKNRNILPRNSEKNLWIVCIVKDDNISSGRKYCYGKIYIHT